MIERAYLLYKRRGKKLNVGRFKSLFRAYLEGWKARWVLKYVKGRDEVKEVMDLVKLSGDL